MRKTRNPGCIWEYYTISLFIFPQNYSYIPFCYENVHGPISALDESLWYCDVANTTKSELFLFIHSLPLAIPCKRTHPGHLQGKYGFLYEKKSIWSYFYLTTVIAIYYYFSRCYGFSAFSCTV